MLHHALHFLNSICKPLLPLIKKIKEQGGTPYLVGGAVRDLMLERTLKDIDIEVHGVTPELLESTLKKFGTVLTVGKKFGVFKLAHHNADWSLPRKDSLGRKPEVFFDSNMTLQEACRRRDLTMNAMAIDLTHIEKNFEILVQALQTNSTQNLAQLFCVIDYFGGLEAITQKKLCAVDTNLFTEDPLRFYRVMQFISRFEFWPDKELTKLCSSMSLQDGINESISKERIYEELRKLFLQSEKPSLGWRWLNSIGRLKELFYELGCLVDVPQRPDYHPEGTVFEHSMQALDAAARFKNYKDDDEKFMLCLAALCHDFGKAVSTDANLSAHGHELTGIPLTKNFIHRFLNSPEIISSLEKLVRHHLMPRLLLDQKSSKAAFKRLAVKLAPQVSMRQLGIVCLADQQGRNGKSSTPLLVWEEGYQDFLRASEDAHVLHAPEPAVLQGKDLLAYVKPGPEMGALLKKAYEIQIEESICDVEELKKRILS